MDSVQITLRGNWIRSIRKAANAINYLLRMAYTYGSIAMAREAGNQEGKQEDIKVIQG
jgi:hypothetical protein